MSKLKKRVAVLTGIRSEYDILFSTLKAIQNHPDLELQVIAAGAHLAPRFGLTVTQIEQDQFPVADRLESLLDSDSSGSRIKSAAIQLQGLVQTLQRLQPQFLLVCGDREEAIMGALAGAYMNIAVAHLAGGDLVVGNVDDSVRHAVTKLSHLHFTFSKESTERVHSLGEEPWRVHCVGNPGLDRFRLIPKLSRQELGKSIGMDLSTGPILLLIQHVISSEIEDAARQMTITLDAVAEMKYKTLIGFPNSDAGSRAIIQVLEDYVPRLPFAKLYKNLARQEFVSLLQTADVLLGNSSLGILEAPFLALPAINVGNRQKKRQHGANIIFVPHDKEDIKQAVQRALHDSTFRLQLETNRHLFGDGTAGDKIADTLGRTPIDRKLLVKDWIL